VGGEREFQSGRTVFGVGGWDGVVRMWEVGSGREVRRMEHGAWVNEREFQSGRTVFGVGGCGWCGSDVGGREWA
jgi:hypothetical protein